MSNPINMEVEAGIMNLEVRIKYLTEMYVEKKYYRRAKEICETLERRIRFGNEPNEEGHSNFLYQAWTNTKEWIEIMERRME